MTRIRCKRKILMGHNILLMCPIKSLNHKYLTTNFSIKYKTKSMGHNILIM